MIEETFEGITGAQRRQVHVVAKDAAWQARTAMMLRRMEVAASVSWGSIRSQMKYANRERVMYVVIRGDTDECVVVRDMVDGEQTSRPFKAITDPMFWKARGVWGPTTVPAGMSIEDLSLGCTEDVV